MKKSPFPIVVILDDDADDRLLLKSAFEECRQDLQIHLFSTGEDLLGYLGGLQASRRGAPALIVMDIHLSGKTGFQVIEEVKTHPVFKYIPLIVLTGSSSDVEIRQSYSLGANTVITKPSSFSELVQMLKTVCDYWFGATKM